MADKNTDLEGIGISGFTLGVASIVLSITGILGTAFSVIGFIFCYFQQTKKPTRLAKVGLIVNIIGFIISLLVILYVLPEVQQQLQNLQ